MLHLGSVLWAWRVLERFRRSVDGVRPVANPDDAEGGAASSRRGSKRQVSVSERASWTVLAAPQFTFAHLSLSQGLPSSVCYFDEPESLCFRTGDVKEESGDAVRIFVSSEALIAEMSTKPGQFTRNRFSYEIDASRLVEPSASIYSGRGGQIRGGSVGSMISSDSVGFCPRLVLRHQLHQRRLHSAAVPFSSLPSSCEWIYSKPTSCTQHQLADSSLIILDFTRPLSACSPSLDPPHRPSSVPGVLGRSLLLSPCHGAEMRRCLASSSCTTDAL